MSDPYPIVTDMVRQIQSSSGASLQVRPVPDATFSVYLVNTDKRSEGYLGKVDVVMETEFARQIGRALIACADECDLKKAEDTAMGGGE